MRIRIPINVLAVAGASAMMLGLGGGAAFAGDHPTPTPTVTVTPPPVVTPQTCITRPVTFAPAVSPGDGSPTDATLSAWHGGTPTPEPTRPVVNPQRCRPETFVAQLTALGSTVVQNRVIATGPVSGTGSLDLPAQTNTFDRFRLPGLFRAVNVPHDGLAFPNVDLRLCTASVTQVGLWRFAGGPFFSLFRHAIGNGTYQLVGQWVFPRLRSGVCSLLFLRGNPILQNRIQPVYTSIQVWGTGLARR